jgi:hypothetical protein
LEALGGGATKPYARAVLDDCRDALADLHNKLQGGEWRRRWAAALVFLRTVRDVLNKDAKRTPELRNAIEAKLKTLEGQPTGEKNWTRKKDREPAIYWGFIDDERNLIVHQYAPRVGQSILIPVSNPDQSVTSYQMNNGPFAVRDPRNLVREAIEWWDKFLGEIEVSCI